MVPELRKSGIEVLGDIPWGSHFCQFYETKKDLLELLVPYFKAGLENNEYCLWIIADPMTIDDALHGLEKTIPFFKKYIEKKSIEILPYLSWFMPTGDFNRHQLNQAWLQKLEEALAKGYDGMRINGNETWLDTNGWGNFMEYELGLNNLLRNRKIIGLCTYPLSHSDGGMVLDVAHTHEAVIAKRKGQWEILEQPEIKKLKSELQLRGDQLERRVEERTHQLKQVVEQLKKEIDERKKAEEQLNQSYEEIRRLSGHLQTAREEERKYIAREIHDELGQYLTVLKMDVSSLRKKVYTPDEAAQRKLDGLTEMIDKIVFSVRRIASELRPSMLDDLGLTAAIGWHLEQFGKQSGIKTEFLKNREEFDLPEPIKTNLFRIFQESLTNIARHSEATKVQVDFSVHDHEFILTITDNGIGFNPENVNRKRTLGILGMKERATIVGGKYKIESIPGKGTKITTTVPLPR